MRDSYAFEVLAIILVVLITYIFSRRNWLYVYKNIFFRDMLYIASVVVFFDYVRRLVNVYMTDVPTGLEVFLVDIVNIGMNTLMVLIMLYTLAQTRCFNIIHGYKLVLLMIPAIVAVGISLLSQPFHLLFWCDGIKYSYNYVGVYVTTGIMIFYLLLSIVTLIVRREELRYKQYILLLVSNISMVVALALKPMEAISYPLSYFVISCIFTVYYLLLHNVEKYLVYTSGCFSNIGFKQVVQEKMLYRKNFYCTSVCISNIQSLSDYCLESEIEEIYHQLGIMLRRIVGRHNVYHVHSAEYVIMSKDEERANRVFFKLRKSLPELIRINDKNISLYYRFFIVGDYDADYNMEDFLRIKASMKKIVLDTASDRQLVSYQGNVRESICRELEVIRLINSLSETDECRFDELPIYNVEAEKITDIELVPRFMLKDGSRVVLEEIWTLSQEIGCSSDLGMMFWRGALKYVCDNKLLENGIEQIRINMRAFHIDSDIICNEYMTSMREFDIEPSRVVMELYVDDDIAGEVIQNRIKKFQDYGVKVCWDQFGVSACNLKNLMEVSFDYVKINHDIVSSYCKEKSNQLMYLVRMMKERGWNIGLDGVSYPDDMEKMSKLEVDYLQGGGFSNLLMKGGNCQGV